jgi:molecular chaperone DnaK
MADIFLSYAREDEACARQLAKALETSGWTVWWDRRIPHGKDFNTYIQQQLDSARCIVVLWSKASIASLFVRDEANQGLSDGRLVPVLIEKVRPPLGFGQIHGANLCDWRHDEAHDEFDRLLQSIEAIVPAPKGAPTRTAPVDSAQTTRPAPESPASARLSRSDARSRPEPTIKSPTGRVIAGFDFGTSYSAVSVIEGGEPVVVTLSEGARRTPSVVAFTKTGERLVGATAKRQAVTNSENTVFSVKRFMGRRSTELAGDVPRVPYIGTKANGDVIVRAGTQEFAPPQIAALVLQKLKQDAEDYVGAPVTRAVITVPGSFNDAQRKAVRDAGTIAGLEVMRIINDSLAVALAYGLGRKKDETVAIVNFGGGAFDVSICEVGEGVVEIKSTAGDQFGGDDIDHRIVQWMLGEYQRTHRFDLSRDSMALQRLKEGAEKAKIELSNASETEISLPFISADASGPKHFQISLTRTRLEELVEDLLQRTVTLTRQALAEAGTTPKQIDKVLLAGGSTRLPRVERLLTELFKDIPLETKHRDEIVVCGAAIQAGILIGTVKDVLPLDVIPLSLGLETLGGVMTTLIPRNTTIPTRKSEVFSTAADSQTSVEIHLVQGERPLARDNVTLGRFQLVGIPAAPRGVPQIEVTFDIDANGIVSVSARDLGTGKEQRVQVSASGLSRTDVDRMRAEAEASADEDRRRREHIEIRNRADQRVYESERLLRESSKLTDAKRAALEEAIASLKGAIAADDGPMMSNNMDRLQQVQSDAARSLYT